MNFTKEQDRYLLDHASGYPYTWYNLSLRFNRKFGDPFIPKHSLQQRFYHLRDKMSIDDKKALYLTNKKNWAREILGGY